MVGVRRFVAEEVAVGTRLAQKAVALPCPFPQREGHDAIPVGGFDVKVQSFAVLALIPIWLYDGRQGLAGKGWKWFSYAFYPLHMLIIGGLARLLG